MRIIIVLRPWNEEENHSTSDLDIHMLCGTDVEAVVIKSGREAAATRGLSAIERDAFEATLLLLGTGNCLVKGFLLGS